MPKESLIPTPIVDVTGRQTIVYRSPEKQNAAKRLPAPKASPTSSIAPTRTPLKQPEPISDSTYDFYRSKNAHDIISSRKTKILRHEAELMEHIRTNDKIDDELLPVVTDYMGMFSPGEKFPDYDYNLLLLAEQHVLSDSPTVDLSSYDTMNKFNRCVSGLPHQRKSEDAHALPRINTEEELGAHLAALRFMLEPQMDSYLKETPFEVDNRETSGIIIKNLGLKRLIYEKYESVDEIITYIKERGPITNKKGVDTLRDYLEDDSRLAPLSDGWL